MPIQARKVDLTSQREGARQLKMVRKRHRAVEAQLTSMLAESTREAILRGRTDQVATMELRAGIKDILHRAGASTERAYVERFL